MADFRQIHTHIWKDPWFLDLKADEKLLFIYLFSNELACLSGLYTIPVKVMAFETDLPRDRIDAILITFQEAGKVYREGNLTWVPNLMRYNAANITSPKIQAHLRTLLDSVSACPLKRRWIAHYNGMVDVGYRIDTVSPTADTLCIPDPESESEHEHDTEQEHEHDTEKKNTGATAPAPTTKPLSEGLRYFLEKMERKRFHTKEQRAALEKCERETGTSAFKRAIDWGARNGIKQADAVMTTARKIAKGGKRGKDSGKYSQYEEAPVVKWLEDDPAVPVPK
jgi:hypothetical protein